VKLPTGVEGAKVLTAGHCGRLDPETFYFDFNTPCGGRDSQAVRNKMCQGKQLARESALDDHTLYELDLDCPYVKGITPFLLDVGEPSLDEGMYLIGHPNRRPKKISFQEVHDDGHHCEVRSFAMRSGKSKRVRYYCDTQGGNSGSPVISARTGHAFAIHTHGGCWSHENSANSGSLLKNSIGVLQKFGIPFVDRSTTDIFKNIQFIEKTVCPMSKTQVSLNKKLDECKTTCMNALKCVGFTHSGSGTDCIVMYEVQQGQSDACPGSSVFYERVYGGTAPPDPAPSPPPATAKPSPKPPCSDTDDRCATTWKGKCSRKKVQKKCPQSCNLCGSPGKCEDKSSKCSKLKSKGRCSKSKVKARCPLSCGVCSNGGS